MKKILILFLYLFFIITLIGCGSSEQKKELNNYKEYAVSYIDNFLSHYDSSFYSESEWNIIVEYINEGKKQIKIAKSKDQVYDIIYETEKVVKSIDPSNKPDASINPGTIPQMKGEEPFTEGDGTADSPYIIDSKGKFIFFSNCINKGIGAYAYYELKTNIDLNGIMWVPIGYLYSRGFKGHFNGNGYEISNFEIVYRLYYYFGEHVGIFGRNDGVIENLGIINLNIDLELHNTFGVENDINVGGVAASNKGVIRNCYSIGKINYKYRGDSSSLPHISIASGGISGENNGGIYNCYSQIDIKIVYQEDDGYIYMAGISYSRYGEIENCLSIYTGKVETSYGVQYEEKIGMNDDNSYLYHAEKGLSCTDEDLNCSDFYTVKLGWSQDVWDFSDIAFENGQYLENKHPKLKKSD